MSNTAPLFRPVPPSTTNNSPFGDDLRSTSSTRLVYTNINGIPSDSSQFPKAHFLFQWMLDNHVSILGLAETNLHWPATQSTIRSICRSYFTDSRLATSSHDSDTQSTYLPGGTAMLTVSPWSTYSTQHTDPSPMGRWSSQTFKGRDGRRLTIITAYRPCRDNISTAGPDTTFARQYHHLLQSGVRSPVPSQAILDDLTTYLALLRQDPIHHIILQLDANEDTHTATRFQRWIVNNGLVDPILHFHGPDDTPTHIRGQRRIDFILVSPSLLPFITACGILPFSTVPSDHRPLFLDFDLQDLLQSTPASLSSRTPRGVQTSNPRSIQLCRSLIRKFLDCTPFESRLLSLLESPHVHGPELNSLDQELTDCLLDIDRKCQRHHNTPWSPTLSSAKRLVYYWQLWHLSLTRHIDTSLQRSSLDIDPDTLPSLPTPPTVTQVRQQLRHSRKAFTQAVLLASQHRQEHLLSLHNLNSTSNDPKLAKRIRNILRSESNRQLFLRFRRAIKGDSGGAISSLDYPAGDTWLSTRDPHLMTSLLIDRNQAHFSQADSSPFATPPLTEFFGPNGTNVQSQQVLDGLFPIGAIDTTPSTKSFLRHLATLRKLSKSKPFDSTITGEDLEKGYSVWRESTTTSPSGRHLGFDKAAMATTNPPDGPPLNFRWFNIKSHFINICLRHDLTLDRWKRVDTMMINKKPGNYRINKLRVIHLIESDFNLLCGILWSRRLLWHADSLNLLGDSNAGFRRQRSSEEVHLFKHLIYGSLRLTRTDAFSFDNDAMACFDRIVLLGASLLGQSLGLPAPHCNVILNTLRDTRYHLKTRHGTSTEFYSSLPDSHLHGPGQGSRSGPGMWALLSCTIIELMKERSPGLSLSDPSGSLDVSQIMTAFADDTTSFVNSFISSLDCSLDLNHLRSLCQDTAQWWEELLHTTGGRLELAKCFVYMIIWTFDDEGVPRLAPSGTLPPISLRDSETTEQYTIDTLDCSLPHKTLGCMDCPTGASAPEFQRLHTKSSNLIRKASSIRVTPDAAFLFLRRLYEPALCYSGPTNVLSYTELHRIHSPCLTTFLPPLGFPPTFPRAVVHGPPSTLGLGIPHLFTVMGMRKVSFLLVQLRLDRPLRRLILIYLRWAQLFFGFPDLLRYPVPTISYIENESWLGTLMEFLRSSSLGLHISDLPSWTAPRESDFFLMVVAATLYDSPAALARINRCRLYLRATFLSDITNAIGDRIPLSTWNLQCSFTHSWKWPVQPRPGPRHLATWRQFLRSLCRDSCKSLSRPLGAWLRQSDRHWTYYLDSTQCTIFRRPTRKYPRWLKASCIPLRRSHHITATFSLCSPPDISNLAPAEVRRRTVSFFPFRPPSIPPSPSDPDPWLSYIHSLPPWETDLLPDCPVSLLLDCLAPPFRPLCVVSDGSHVDQHGTYGCAFGHTKSSPPLVLYAGRARGLPMQSHRSEAYGLLSGLTTLLHYITFLSFDHPVSTQIHFYLDNKSVVDSSVCLPNPLSPDWDVLAQIHSQLTRLRALLVEPPSVSHVKGHQDSRESFDSLTLPSQLNCLADEIAGAEMQRVLCLEPPPMIPFPSCPIYLTKQSALCGSRERHDCLWFWAEHSLQHYLGRRLKLPVPLLHRFNWVSFSSFLSRLPRKEHTFHVKFVIDWLHSGARSRLMHRESNCHLCPDVLETVDHIFQCPHRSQARRALAHDFASFLRQIGTSPDLCLALDHGFRSYLDLPTSILLPASVSYAYSEQTRLGWRLLIRGLHSNQWHLLQHSYLSTLPKTDRTQESFYWNRRVILWLHTRARSIWIERTSQRLSTSHPQHLFEREIHASVEKLYSLAPTLSAHDRHLFDVPLADRLKQPWRSLRTWVSLTYPTVKLLQARHQERLSTGLRDIRSFFRPRKRRQPPRSPTRTSPKRPRRLTQSTLVPQVMHTPPEPPSYFPPFPPPPPDPDPSTSPESASTSSTDSGSLYSPPSP